MSLLVNCTYFLTCVTSAETLHKTCEVMLSAMLILDLLIVRVPSEE